MRKQKDPVAEAPKPEIPKAPFSKLPLRINKEVWVTDFKYNRKMNHWDEVRHYGILAALSANKKIAFFVRTSPSGKVERFQYPTDCVWQTDENRKA